MSSRLAKRGAQDSDLLILPFGVWVDGREIEFFLNIHKVLRVDELSVQTAVPEHCAPIAGLVQRYEDPLPVVDLARWLQGRNLAESAEAEKPEGWQQRLLVVSALGTQIGLIVSRTRRVMRVPNTDMQPVPDAILAQLNCVNAVLRLNGSYRFMLDIESLMVEMGAHSQEPKTINQGSVDLNGRRVLVVEDSKLFSQYLKLELQKYGAEVVMASDGQEGYQLLEKEHENICAVITDIEMPIMNGVDMVRRFKVAFPQTKLHFLFYTSISNSQFLGDIERDGLGQWVEKADGAQVFYKLGQVLAA